MYMTSESTFYRWAEEWLYRLLELNPVAATQLGDHRWDDRLAAFSPEAIENEHQELLAALAQLQAMDIVGFGPEAQIDHTLMTHILGAFIRQHEKLRRVWRDPGGYLDQVLGGVLVLILREFAPLPERLRSALGRVREAPRVLREAQTNLVPAQVPKVWAEVAVEQAQQAAGFFAGLLPSLAAGAAPNLQADLEEAGQTAAQALQAYVRYLQEELIPQAAGDFAAGRELFDEILREEHLMDYDAERLLAIGWEQFRQTQVQMEALAREIDPQKAVSEILEDAKADHPTAEGLLAAYETAMAQARQYVIEHDIATIPAHESLRIIETPAYLRPLVPYAGYMPAGILEERQEGIFVVTPVDPAAPPQQQEQVLKGHSYAKLPVTALHEAYPGHHLQLVWSNQRETIPRRMASFLSTLFVEGWAFYCEELMEQLGYIATPLQRLARLSDQLFRAARIILDVSLHTRGMSVDEAVSLLVNECHLEPTSALAEVRWYTQLPTQPQSYLMGKLRIVELVADYRSIYPEASLRQVHDAILGCGSLPPRLMRQQLLGG
jgi:uncharacterized protein (DUF885 family)